MNYRITILLILALFSISTSPIVAKMLNNVPAITISFWRMFIGSCFLWLYSCFKKQGEMKNKKNYQRTYLAGILLGIHFALFFGSIKLTLIANATFLGTLAPLFTLIIEFLILKRFFGKKVIIGLILSFIGAIIILGSDFDISAKYTLGNLFAISCSLCLALSFLIAEKVRNIESTIVYSRLLYLSAAITLLIIAIFTNSSLFGYSWSDYFGLLFLGIVPTIIGHNAIYYSVKYVSPTIVATFPLGEPIIATILAYFIFNEIIGFEIYIGGFITMCGLIIISLKKNKK